MAETVCTNVAGCGMVCGGSRGCQAKWQCAADQRITEMADIRAEIIIQISNREQADQPWLAASAGNLDAIQHRLDNLQMSYMCVYSQNAKREVKPLQC